MKLPSKVNPNGPNLLSLSYFYSIILVNEGSISFSTPIINIVLPNLKQFYRVLYNSTSFALTTSIYDL
jgi:hypothetical protein